MCHRSATQEKSGCFFLLRCGWLCIKSDCVDAASRVSLLHFRLSQNLYSCATDNIYNHRSLFGQHMDVQVSMQLWAGGISMFGLGDELDARWRF